MSPVMPPLRTPRATGLRCPALGALKLECTFVNCTTLLVKGTSGHLKHRGGGILMSSMLQHNDLWRLTSRNG